MGWRFWGGGAPKYPSHEGQRVQNSPIHQHLPVRPVGSWQKTGKHTQTLAKPPPTRPNQAKPPTFASVQTRLPQFPSGHGSLRLPTRGTRPGIAPSFPQFTCSSDSFSIRCLTRCMTLNLDDLMYQKSNGARIDNSLIRQENLIRIRRGVYLPASLLPATYQAWQVRQAISVARA